VPLGACIMGRRHVFRPHPGYTPTADDLLDMQRVGFITAADAVSLASEPGQPNSSLAEDDDTELLDATGNDRLSFVLRGGAGAREVRCQDGRLSLRAADSLVVRGPLDVWSRGLTCSLRLRTRAPCRAILFAFADVSCVLDATKTDAATVSMVSSVQACAPHGLRVLNSARRLSAAPALGRSCCRGSVSPTRSCASSSPGCVSEFLWAASAHLHASRAVSDGPARTRSSAVHAVCQRRTGLLQRAARSAVPLGSRRSARGRRLATLAGLTSARCRSAWRPVWMA
jgi:hypothetical protein